MWPSLCQALAESINLLLPAACLLCGEALSTAHARQSFCGNCLADMPSLSPAHCSCCAQPFPNSSSSHLCGICLQRPPAFSAVHVAGLYQGSIKAAIQRLKYRNQLILARPLGQQLGRVVAASAHGFAADRIVPVPLHPDRLRRRGYNQALEIARPIARQMAVPLDTSLLQRVLSTPQQQGLTATERRSNLRGAFALAAGASKLRVLLIDDVMTTGETVRECCRTLLAGDVAEIQVAVVGRA